MRIRGKSLVGKTLFFVFVIIPLCLAMSGPFFVAGGVLGALLVYTHNLPELPELSKYQPRTVSTFYSDDGTVIGIFYEQKRFVVELTDIPPDVIEAFIAAEDERFYQHKGVDWRGIARAAYNNIKDWHLREGASTITQQVTRNFSLTAEKKVARKVREIILALRVEEFWSKKRILYVYLNEIYLGDGCYGVEAAARNYFDKPVQHLTLAEGALIAGIVPSPERYNPFKNKKKALLKQRLVLENMLKVGFITEQEYEEALNQKLEFRKEITKPFDLVPDFAEAVRRYIIDKYGKEELYKEGLKVFTTCRIDHQKQAIQAMEKGLKEIQERQKHLAVMRSLKISEIPDYIAGRQPPELIEGNDYQGVVTKVVKKGKKETHLHVSLSPGFDGLVKLTKDLKVYKVGNVLALRFKEFKDGTALFEPDEEVKLQGGLVCIENRTGYVRALVAGSSREHYQFNRAMQGRRQPGSAIKPIIYAVALEKNSYSPGTIIVDEDIEIEIELNKQLWTPRNADGKFLGPISFRRALELSRNICTIKILMDTGSDPVISMARKMGINSKLRPHLSLSLGASEVTLFELTSAYTVFPNSGVYVEPVLVKRIEDRHGDVLEDNTLLIGLQESEIPHPEERLELAERNRPGARSGWDIVDDEKEPQNEFSEEDVGAEPDSVNVNPEEESGDQETTEEVSPEKPVIPGVNIGSGSGTKTGLRRPLKKKTEVTKRREKAALSPQTAYTMTSLLQGAVRRGTGARVRRYLKRNDLAGKTGTTNNAEDAWFIGFNPDFTTGVWVGFDEKRSMGRREAGSRAALPIWGYFMKSILAGVPAKSFAVPPNICFSEMLTFEGNKKEGFAPETVREPVYCPMEGETLVLSPLDNPELLAALAPPAAPEDPHYEMNRGFPAPNQYGPPLPYDQRPQAVQPGPAMPYQLRGEEHGIQPNPAPYREGTNQPVPRSRHNTPGGQSREQDRSRTYVEREVTVEREVGPDGRPLPGYRTPGTVHPTNPGSGERYPRTNPGAYDPRFPGSRARQPQ
jgi:penicillin-binding protein 1A